MEPILYALQDGVATITLNRPEVMNALSSALRRDMLAAIQRAEGEARVIVFTGAGRAFCSGQDLADAQSLGAEVPFEGGGLTLAQALGRVGGLRDERADIRLWIHSPGGSVASMLALRDVMRLVPCDVGTLAIGLACSAGQFLLSAGTPGKRMALPHAPTRPSMKYWRASPRFPACPPSCCKGWPTRWCGPSTRRSWCARACASTACRPIPW